MGMFKIKNCLKFGYLDFIHRGRFLDWISLPGEEVLSEGVEDVGTEDHALFDLATLRVGPPADGDVHVDDLELVGLGDLQWRFQHVQKLREVTVGHVLGAVRVELLPNQVWSTTQMDSINITYNTAFGIFIST